MTPEPIETIIGNALERLERSDISQYSDYLEQAVNLYGANAVRDEMERRKRAAQEHLKIVQSA